MEQTALQTDFETNLPPLLSAIVKQLRLEGIYLDDAPLQEKKSQRIERMAVEAMLESVRHAAVLLSDNLSLADAARLLEKIQVAAVTAQKAAFISHTDLALRCSEAVQQIAHQCRDYFHDLKLSRQLLRKN